MLWGIRVVLYVQGYLLGVGTNVGAKENSGPEKLLKSPGALRACVGWALGRAGDHGAPSSPGDVGVHGGWTLASPGTGHLPGPSEAVSHSISF